MKTRQKRVTEKIKEFHHTSSHSITTGTRNGPGKLVVEFYDLISIWGDSSFSKSLTFTVESADNSDEPHELDSSTEKDAPWNQTTQNSFRGSKVIMMMLMVMMMVES